MSPTAIQGPLYAVCTESGMENQRLQTVRQRLSIASREEDTAARGRNQLNAGTDPVGGHDREPTGQRLVNRNSPRLIPGRMHKHIRDAKPERQRTVSGIAGTEDSIGQQ